MNTLNGWCDFSFWGSNLVVTEYKVEKKKQLDFQIHGLTDCCVNMCSINISLIISRTNFTFSL